MADSVVNFGEDAGKAIGGAVNDVGNEVGSWFSW